MLDNPYEVPQAFVPKAPEPDFRNEFYHQLQDMRPNEGGERPATMKVCRYLDGRHESPPREWCPHFNHEDETGKRIVTDWTAQWED
jgi:hypothetical protein